MDSDDGLKEIIKQIYEDVRGVKSILSKLNVKLIELEIKLNYYEKDLESFKANSKKTFYIFVSAIATFITSLVLFIIQMIVKR